MAAFSTNKGKTMTPFEKLEDAIDKKERDGKKHKRSAGMKVIRKRLAEYKKSLDKSWWERMRDWLK